MKFFVTHDPGSPEERREELEGDTLTIGTDPTNVLCLSGSKVAPFHARVGVEAGRLLVVDLDSGLDTYLDGRLVWGEPRTLPPRAVLRLGDEGPEVQIEADLGALARTPGLLMRGVYFGLPFGLAGWAVLGWLQGALLLVLLGLLVCAAALIEAVAVQRRLDRRGHLLIALSVWGVGVIGVVGIRLQLSYAESVFSQQSLSAGWAATQETLPTIPTYPFVLFPVFMATALAASTLVRLRGLRLEGQVLAGTVITLALMFPLGIACNGVFPHLKMTQKRWHAPVGAMMLGIAVAFFLPCCAEGAAARSRAAVAERPPPWP